MVPGRNVPLFTGFTLWWFYKPEAGAQFHFCFARETVSAIFKVAMLAGSYELICVCLSHPNSRFITGLEPGSFCFSSYTCESSWFFLPLK